MSKTITAYTTQELKEKFTDGFEKAFEEFSQDQWHEIPWQNEIIDSLKATFKQAGITLKDWSLGAYASSYVKFYMDDEIGDFTKAKAMAWLKEQFEIKSARLVKYKDEHGKNCRRYEFTGLEGKPWDCPMTGVCFDYDFVESLFLDIHDGYSLKDAFGWLADKCETMLENELKYAQSEENFLEMSDANDWHFFESGRQA